MTCLLKAWPSVFRTQGASHLVQWGVRPSDLGRAPRSWVLTFGRILMSCLKSELASHTELGAGLGFKTREVDQIWGIVIDIGCHLVPSLSQSQWKHQVSSVADPICRGHIPATITTTIRGFHSGLRIATCYDGCCPEIGVEAFQVISTK